MEEATYRETWRSVVDTATLKKSTPWEEPSGTKKFQVSTKANKNPGKAAI